MESCYVCFLTVLSVVLMSIWLVRQYRRDNRETEDRLNAYQGIMKRVLFRLNKLEEKPKPQQKDSPLTAAGVEESLKSAGYEPKKSDSGVSFVKDDELYVVDTRRMPRIFISKGFAIEPKDWDIELLKQAAHLMSDDIIMLKANINEQPDEDGNMHLTFFIAALERTQQGFGENLKDYIDIISDGQQRLGQRYDELKKEKEGVSSLNTLASSSFQHSRKTPS